MREVERPADADDLGWVQQVAGTPNSGRGGYLSLRDLFVGPDLLSALAAAGELNVYDHVAAGNAELTALPHVPDLTPTQVTRRHRSLGQGVKNGDSSSRLR